MEEKIKSKHIKKIIFSFLHERTKLKIIKYNKTIQNILNIYLIDYKLYSKKYIIYETKNKGKEYYFENDNLIFEGEFLKGERNGKGKEYHSFLGSIIFEGEYLNGKRNGKGKEYNCYNGRVIFEGEYLNGKKNGKGIEYFRNGKLNFECQYINGKKIYIKQYNPKNNSTYELKNGQGFIKEFHDIEMGKDMEKLKNIIIVVN